MSQHTILIHEDNDEAPVAKKRRSTAPRKRTYSQGHRSRRMPDVNFKVEAYDEWMCRKGEKKKNSKMERTS